MLKNPVTKTDWHDKLLENKVIWEYPGHGPHVIFSLNDSHSDFYINSDYLACNPPLAREISLGLFNTIVGETQTKPDWILTYPPFGLHIGFCLAELFNCKFAFIKSLQEPEIYFDLKANERVLLCADDMGSGKSMSKVIEAAISKRVKIIDPIAVTVNRSGKSTFNDMQIISLLEQEVNIWPPEDCSLCATGSPALPARENWLEFTGAC